MNAPPDPQSLYSQVTAPEKADNRFIARLQEEWSQDKPDTFILSMRIARLLKPNYDGPSPPFHLIEKSKKQKSFEPFLHWIHESLSLASSSRGGIDHDQERATVNSWSTGFKGTADTTLMSIISGYLKVSHLCNDASGSPYSNQTFLVNSSGTGKSRLMDQLGEKHCLVIPICLRSDESTGYPPPDRELRNWLIRPETATVQQVAYSLLYGLFTTTRKCFETITGDEQQDRNAEFLDKMGSDIFDSHSEYRDKFYKGVVASGKEFAETLGANPPEKNDDVRDAAESLLKECKDTTVVLSFDEAHVLARRHSQERWTLLEQIRRAMRSVLQQKIFAICLTTHGKYRLMSPEPIEDSSSRIIDINKTLFPPITEVGFNQLAKEMTGPPTLELVTELEYICHLGRPLWASRWDAGSGTIRRDIVDFAKKKLLGPAGAPGESQILACLAVRFPIQFRRNQREVELSLVENHMRFCLKADTRLRLRTTAPSEPLLAEAAFEHLHYEHSDSFLATLAGNLDTWGVHLGDRGELVMMLIWMRARDLLVGTSTTPPRPWNPFAQSVISVSNFMKQLLPQSLSHNLDTMPPSVGTGSSSFAQAFADCRIWCNHFIQVQDYKVLHVEFLCALLSNGIGVLCAPNQAGIDLLWIGLKGSDIRPENIVLILGQAKNDMAYKDKVDRTVLDAMDPVKLGICTAKHPVPVIRIVFALASRTTKTSLVPPAERTSARHPNTASLTSYDFWFAGLGDAAFGCVEGNEVRHYRDLLAASGPLYVVDNIVDMNRLGLPQMEDEDRKDLERELRNANLSTSSRLDRMREGNPFTMAEECHFPAPWQVILSQFRKEKDADTQEQGVNDMDVDSKD